MANKKRATQQRSEKSAGGILGRLAELRPVRSVDKNTWNANRMTPHKRASLKHGLQTDGWLTSQALTVWGRDERGRERNLIIDGEHRWEVALELGTFDLVPMVVLDGLTEAQAKAWTLKLARHGEPREDLLAGLVSDLSGSLDVPDLGLEVGIESDRVAELLAYPGGASESARPERSASKETTKVQLVFDARQHRRWQAAVAKLAKRPGARSVSECALEAVERAVRGAQPRPEDGHRARA